LNVPLTRDQVLNARDVRTVSVPCTEEWGGDILVRTISGTERDAFEETMSPSAANGRPNMRNVRARFVALVAVDEAGDRLFQDKDAEALGKKSAAALDRVFVAGWKLNRMSKQAIEDAEKNSGDAPSGDSISGSPSPSA
jgi:hypothetical protein